MPNDHTEFSHLFRDMYPKLCRFLEHLLGDPNQAQDVAQEAMLRLYRLGMDRVPEDEIRFWLFRVARNLALNALARRQTRHRLVDTIKGFFQAAPETPEKILERTEHASLLHRLLATLPEDQRAALLLREQEEMKYGEIAAVLGVSESKVKVDVFRARQTLRQKWNEHHKTSYERRRIGNG